MQKKGKAFERGPPQNHMDAKDPEMDFKKIMKEIDFLGSSRMSWKERKQLENRKVVALGGKPPKKQLLPLSVARAAMKNRKKREKKILEENEALRRFGIGLQLAGGGSRKKTVEKRRLEDRTLISSEGRFRNGVLDVKDLLQPASGLSMDDDGPGDRVANIGKKKKKGGGKKKHGKKKGGGRKCH